MKKLALLLASVLAPAGLALGQSAGGPPAGCPDPSKCPVSIPAAEAEWQKIFPEMGADGPEIAILRVDPKTQATQLMIRSMKAVYVPWHWHTANETHTVLAGVFTAECEGKVAELGPGSFNFIPARMIHRAWMSDACTLFITVDSAWDLNWVEGPPRPPKPGDPPPPAPGATGAYSPNEGRFDGLRIDSVEVAEAPGSEATPGAPRSRAVRDPLVVEALLRMLGPREVKPSGGETRWVVTLHAGKGGFLHQVWVYGSGEWGYGGRSRGASADLPRALEALLGS